VSSLSFFTLLQDPHDSDDTHEDSRELKDCKNENHLFFCQVKCQYLIYFLHGFHLDITDLKPDHSLIPHFF